MNLLTNAIKFCFLKTKIIVEVDIRGTPQSTGAALEVKIRDTGIGIEASEMTKIFKPYYSSEIEGGRGLGLSVCKQICAMMGG
jgi:signal transduction histidine kinase